MSKDTIYRQLAIETIRKCAVKEVTPAYMLIDKAEAMTELMNLPSAEPEPSELARDIATIIEDEMDMRVVLKNAELEPCDFCVYKDDCDEMRIYCPARGVTE